MEAQHALPEHGEELQALMGKGQRADPLLAHPQIFLRSLPKLKAQKGQSGRQLLYA